MATSCSDLTPYDPNYRTIPLTRGMVAIVDAKHFERLNQYKWQVSKSKHGRFYAVRSSAMDKGVRGPTIRMHRQILGLLPGDPHEVDHRSPGHTLVNVEANLRVVTHSQNNMNVLMRRNNKCGYKGVRYHAKMRKYEARITVNRHRIALGFRDTARAAHEELYVPAAITYFGEYANFG